ncbi:small-subunit processome [Zychaea mexicana]|uniref:small-subunit processome n=1 Tax=Zychaea mexicana TaxID=64656 RepID=UPI0022FE6669|nr:small-subunit processome [Zychaea mexicana]KAI9491358.1 small-subunit processome [Zychaea mexicana]
MPPQRKGRKGNRGNNNNGSATAGSNSKIKKNKKSFSVNDVFEADDNERSLKRKGHDLDDVDDYEYNNGDAIASEDDEEIESDDAFNESDDERFEHFKFSGSNKDKKPKKVEENGDDQEVSEQEINMNESEDDNDYDDGEDDEEDGEGFMDLSTMLDDDADENKSSHRDAVKALMQQGDSDSEEDEEAMLPSDDDDEEEDEAMEDDVKFIDSLETKKRKRDEAELAKKRQRQQERTEVYEENEFNLLARSTATGGNKKLDLNDLMGTMDNEGTFTTMRKSLLELDGKGKNVVKSALEAPVAKRLQDRADRQAAYKETNKEVSRWDATVNENRQAEHLHFPLQAPKKRQTTTSATLASKFAAQTTMEQQIEAALAEAGMKEEELEEFEALQLNKLSVEEVQRRRQELQMMRELMFRSEIKAKRLKKIKSKSYRKLQRKERARQELQAAGLGNEVDHEMTADQQMEAAMARAEERMSLKHKNTSQWAKRALARGQQDEGTREAILDQLRRGDELRKKVHGGADGSDSDYNSDDDDSDGDDEGHQDAIANDLVKLQQEIDQEAQDTQPKKGLLNMKFMQDAEKRKMAATKAMVDDFQNKWLDEDSEEAEAEKAAGKLVQNNPGRLAFGSNVKGKTAELSSNDNANVELNDAGQIKKVSHTAAHNTRTSGAVETSSSKQKSALDAELDNNSDANVSPWLQQVESRVKGKKASKKHNTAKGKIDDKAELNIEKIKKSRKGAQETEDIELDLTQTLSMDKKKKNSSKKTEATIAAPSDTTTIKEDTASKPSQQQQQQPAAASKKKQATVTATQLNDSDDGEDYSSDDNDAGMVHASNKKVAFAQKELVARAFANDNVVQEFEEEKAAVVKEQGDQTEDLTLPGWGAWSGKGMKKNKKNKIVKTTKGVDPLKRKDAKLKNVIINEKRNKKVEKYEITQVPYPFQTMEQYERSLRAPVGKEWNTRDTFQKLTKPRVLTKLGTVINPLDAPFK